MLVLTRKANESIMIGDEIEVSILCIKGDKVKVGISAPRSVPVLRTEIYVRLPTAESLTPVHPEVDLV